MKMSHYFALPVSAMLVVSAVPANAEAANIQLKDINGYKYEHAIRELVKEGVITGHTDGTYRPETALRRWDIVVLLGRYLESKGYKVPADYKTNMRFKDLTPKSEDMLLKYAALVYEQGVFIGNHEKKLLYNELLSRHHAALVLVRMMNKLDNTDYTTHSQQDYYADISRLPEKDRQMISLFHQLGIVEGLYYNPSKFITRGEFAHFLYEIRGLSSIQLEEQITVVRSEVVKEDNNEYLKLRLSENVQLLKNASVSMKGYMEVNGQKRAISSTQNAHLFTSEDEPNVVYVLLSDLLRGSDRENTTYDVNLTLNNVVDEVGNLVDEIFRVKFVRTKDAQYNANRLQLVSVDTTRSNSAITNPNQVVLQFNYALDVESAESLSNYKFENRLPIESVEVNRKNPKQVIVKLAPNTVAEPTVVELQVSNLRAQNAVYVMGTNAFDIPLSDNTRPSLTLYSITSKDKITVYDYSMMTGENELTLTFDEAVQGVKNDLFIVKNDKGEIIGSTATQPSEKTKVVITLNRRLQANEVITLQIRSTRKLTDMYNNEVLRLPIEFKVPYY